jgi:signal transduction histidine kinase/pSer/pThr/pTyr-binding forkhead associated (FHA) protein
MKAANQEASRVAAMGGVRHLAENPAERVRGENEPRWSAMVRLRVVQGPDEGKVVEASSGVVSLGSAPDNDLQVTDSFVSRHHGRLMLAGEEWRYEDRGSTNGSAIERGGERSQVGGEGVALEQGDRIVVGGTAIEVEIEEKRAAEVPLHTVVATRTVADLDASRERQRASLDDLAAGYELEKGISLAFEPEEMLDAILEAMLGAFPAATHAIILLVDKATTEPKRQVARVRGEGRRHEGELPISRSVASRVLREGRSMLFSDVEAEFAGVRSVVAAGLKSSLCAPLWTGQETVGLVQVESRGGRAAFCEGDIERLSLFANRAALAIVGCELTEAERRNEMMQDLSHMITHDLKGPLTSVLAFLELLGMEELQESQKQYVGFALNGAKWLSLLIAGILDVAKMEGSEPALRQEPLELETEIREALALIDYQFSEKKMRAVVEVAEGLPPVPADRELFRRTVLNLVGNAVSLSPSETTVTVSAERAGEGDSVVVSVRDEGPGIPEEYRGRIFDKFFQAESRQQAQRKMSVGLGLAFCKLAVEAHGGRIWAESVPGEGATFRFTLPVNPA